jgi:uracil DNA glycosylase
MSESASSRWSAFSPYELKIIATALEADANITSAEQEEHDDLRKWAEGAESMLSEVLRVRAERD